MPDAVDANWLVRKYGELPLDHPDNGWTICSAADATVRLPTCGSVLLGRDGWHPWLLAAASGSAAVLVLAAAVALHALHGVRARRARQVPAAAGEKGLLLLQYNRGNRSNNNGGRQVPQRREHAEIERQMLDLSQRGHAASASVLKVAVEAQQAPRSNALPQQFSATASWQQEVAAAGQAAESVRAIRVNHPDEGWTVCYNATTSVHLPACSPSVVRSSSSSRRVLAAAVGGAAVLVMAAVVLLPAVRREHAQRAAAAPADKEGLQLLLQYSRGSAGSSRTPKRREHAEIERRLHDLSQRMHGASADEQGLVIGAHRPPELSALTQQLPGTASWQQESAAGDGPSTSGRASEPLCAATAFGPLSLRLSDLTFTQGSPTSGSSSSAGLVEIGAGTSSKVRDRVNAALPRMNVLQIALPLPAVPLQVYACLCLCGLTVWFQQEQACSTDFVVRARRDEAVEQQAGQAN